MKSSFTATLYPDETTEFMVSKGTHINPPHGRAYCRVEVDGLAIQTNCWEDMQRLVDALNQAIVNAQAGEAAEAITGDVEAVSS